LIAAEISARLARIVGPENISAGRFERRVYSYDASLVEGLPDAVVFPGDVEQTSAVVREITRAGLPIVPRGFGTNLSGGSIALRGGVIVSLARLNRILGLEPLNRRAVVQPAVTNLELQQALSSLGFFYAPDPASQKVATLGGNASENSGGPRCLKYGVTTNHILELEVVMPDGELVRLGGPNGDAAGYDLRGVMIGSEGTFGLITELTLRILPQPESVLTMLAVYDDLPAAAVTVSEIIAAGIVPAALEMMDRPVMRAVEDSFPCGYPLDAAAVLIIEVEGLAAGLASQAERIERICLARGCREVREAKTREERDRLWAGRRGALGAVARLAPRYLVADCTVPRTRLPEALESVRSVAERYGLAYGNVFHAGDGNLHPLLLFDPTGPDAIEQVHRAGFEIMRACVDLGGTITGEHGIGAEKKEAMRLVFSEADLAVMQGLKQSFDPEGLLNPGKMFPAESIDPDSNLPPGPWPDPDGELRPEDEGQAAEMVRWAAGRSRALRPIGLGRRREFGNQASRPLVDLHSTGLPEAIDHDPANQLVTVGAGTSLRRLQAVLSQGGQWLPLRPPRTDGWTIGGLVALNACGPDRLAYGAPRDLLLGLRFVSGRGCPIQAGGRVVKNVAGYDMTRLMAGSAGTLGFLTKLNFKVAPLPQSGLILEAAGLLDPCARAAEALLTSPLEPIWAVAVPAPDAAALSGPWILNIGFEGLEEPVRDAAGRGRELLARAGLEATPARAFERDTAIWDALFGPLDQAPCLLRLDLPPDRIADCLAMAGPLIATSRVVLDLGLGRLSAGMEDLSNEAWARLCALAAEHGGRAFLEKAPPEFKRENDVFGPARPEWRIGHRIKALLDPGSIFAPGCLPGGK